MTPKTSNLDGQLEAVSFVTASARFVSPSSVRRSCSAGDNLSQEAKGSSHKRESMVCSPSGRVPSLAPLAGRSLESLWETSTMPPTSVTTAMIVFAEKSEPEFEESDSAIGVPGNLVICGSHPSLPRNQLPAVFDWAG